MKVGQEGSGGQFATKEVAVSPFAAKAICPDSVHIAVTVKMEEE